jgi:predicted transcriptional regulator
MTPDLLKLQKLLESEMSAKTIARVTRVSIPTAHRRLRALMEAGARLKATARPSGKTGPIPVTFRLLKAAP